MMINQTNNDNHKDNNPFGALFFVAIYMIYYGYQKTKEYIAGNEVLQKFIALPFHHYFWVALLFFTGISCLLFILQLSQRESDHRKSRLPFIILTLLTVWIIIGVAKGIKYHYFEQYGIWGAIQFGIVHGNFQDGLNALFVLLISCLTFLWIIQITAKIIAFLLNKIPIISRFMKWGQEDFEAGLFFGKSLRFILIGWIVTSLLSFGWLMI